MRLQQTQSGISQRFSDSASAAPLDRQQLQQEQQKCQHDLYSQQQQHHQQLGVIHPLSAPLPEMYSLLPPRQSSHFTEVHPPLIGHQPHYSPSPLPQSLYMSSYSPSAAQESLHGIKPFTGMTGFQTHASTDHEPNNHDGGERHTTDVIDHHKPYVCNHQDCGKAFKQNGNLKTHKRKHTGERPYQCNYEGCGKAFAQLGNLQTHEKIHWPVKPYLCDFPHCNRGFTQRANLKVHLFRIHYSNTS